VAFRESLLRALQTWFGYSAIAVMHGKTLDDALLGGNGVKSGYSQALLDQYAARWIGSDPFLTAAARRMLAARGVVTLADLRPSAVPAQREYVERSCGRTGSPTRPGWS
jgi:hypothetical protein